MEFCSQIQAMIDRGTARLLSDEELNSWKGDYHYLSMVGARDKSGRKPLRVCYDAARKVAGYPSFNECVHKGPDRFINDILSVTLEFRNGRVGCAADIIKFHNQVHLVQEDVHMQRFLWRFMNRNIAPQTYCIVSNNFGVKPANCIATTALYLTADIFADIYRVESEEVKTRTYVDDQLTAADDKNSALIKTQR